MNIEQKTPKVEPQKEKNPKKKDEEPCRFLSVHCHSKIVHKKKVHENVLVSPKCHQSITKVHPRRWPKKEGVVVTQKSSATKKTFPQVFCSCCSPFPPQVERYN